VDGISFEIRRDEIFGLLGPNGSGKSTTIKMILGLLRKTRGQLVAFGRDPSDVGVKKRIGYLPEESYMYRFLNPRETLDFYGKLFGLDRAARKRRTGELLEMVGLQYAAFRPVGEFSKGMTRRLGIAQALINDPDLLILDEPTSGLDPIGSRQMKDLLLDLGRRGKTILLSSHHLDDVQDVCDRMVILYGGKIRREGTVDQLLEDTDRTVIQTPRLKPETIGRIETVLQQSEHVGIERVSAPKQRLEDLFLQIVDQARAEQAANSGAQAGGATAAFLRGDAAEVAGGGALIEELQKPAEQVRPARPPKAEPVAPTGPAQDVLGDLLKPQETPKAAAPVKPAQPDKPGRASPEVDRGVIDDLLGGGPQQ
jgi:ABC-2 type transport system ATP-binding protein